MKLRRWDDYPGADKAHNSGVDLKVYTDNNAAYTDLQAGNLDLVDDIPAAQLRNVKSDLGGRYINQPAGILQTLAFPFYDKDWGDGEGEAPHRPVDGHRPRADHPADLPGHPHPRHRLDLAGARRRRRLQAGPVRRRLHLQPGGGEEADQGGRRAARRQGHAHLERRHRLAPRVARRRLQQHQQHPRARTRPARSPRSAPSRTTATGMRQPEDDRPVPRRLADGLPADPELPPAAVLHRRLLQRRPVQQPDFDALVNKANAESDPAKAVAMFHDAEKILAAKMPAIPLWYQNGSAGYSERLSHVALNPFSVPVYNEIRVG